MTQVELVHERSWTRSSATWLAGFGSSLVGDEIFYIALTWAAVQITSPAGVGMVLIANAVPRAVLLLVGGMLVDRVGPKCLVIAADTARALIMVGTGLALTQGSVSLTLLVVIAVLFGMADGFFLPAVGAMPAFVAPRSGQTRLQALRTITMRGATFLGAPLGSWLIVAGTVSAAFWANAALFAVSVVALAVTRVRPTEVDIDVDPQAVETRPPSEQGAAGRWWRELTEGLRVVVRHPTMLALILLVACLELGFTGPATAGIPLLSAETGWGVRGVGWLLGAFGVGAAATAGVLAMTRSAKRPGLIMGLALTAMGVGVGMIGLVTRVPVSLSLALGLAVAAALVTGMGAGLFGTLVNGAVLSVSPPAQVGRVMSVVSLASFTAMPVSLAATGWVTGLTDAAVPFLAGGALIALSGIGACLSQRIRQLAL